MTLPITVESPCGGAFGCGHRVDLHGLQGCMHEWCPCDFTSEDWAYTTAQAAAPEEPAP